MHYLGVVYLLLFLSRTVLGYLYRSLSSQSRLQKSGSLRRSDAVRPHIELRLQLDRVFAISRPVEREKQIIGDPISSMPARSDLRLVPIEVASGRSVVPGDFIVHEEFGVGKYLGVKVADVSTASDIKSNNDLQVPTVVVQFKDAEISWYKKYAQQQLWMYRAAETGEQELSSIADRKKWKRRKKSVEASSKSMALSLINLMAVRDGLHRTPCLPDHIQPAYADFEAAFPFEPTEDQKQCFQAIAVDMVNSTRPMDRLVCGDVGFGKTEVAMRAIYRAVLSNRQVAFLCPTRVLAKQHERTLKLRMPGVSIILLRGGGKDGAAKIKEEIADGSCQVVVGTHALLQSTVTFNNLGLLVVDEEQRFGVAHKEKLKSLSSGTDVLTLSATPIPRTLQLSLSGLRDFSQLRSPPEGRRAVRVAVGPEDPETVVRALRRELQRGGQVFVVVPFVEHVAATREQLLRWWSEFQEIQERRERELQRRGGLSSLGHPVKLQKVDPKMMMAGRSLEKAEDEEEDKEEVEKLELDPAGLSVDNKSWPELRIIEAHGRHEDLEERIDLFLQKEANVLVATTVIENGIDMSNVNTIIVMTADRFGLASLYQLKGRVGRSPRQAYAYFMTGSSDDSTVTPDDGGGRRASSKAGGKQTRPTQLLTIQAEQRLTYLKTFTKLGAGYDLSRRDMEMRGHGSLFGAEQSGSRDIGLDLQASMLTRALQEARQDLILPAAEIRIDDGGWVSSTGVRQLGPMPPAVDVNAVSRWEAGLVELALSTALLGLQRQQHGSGSGSSSGGGRRSKKSKNGAISVGVDDDEDDDEDSTEVYDIVQSLAREVLEANSVKAYEAALEKIEFNIRDQAARKGATPTTTEESLSIARELIARCRLRRAARSLGVTEMYRRVRHIPTSEATLRSAPAPLPALGAGAGAGAEKLKEIPRSYTSFEFVMTAPEMTAAKWFRLCAEFTEKSRKALKFKELQQQQQQQRKAVILYAHAFYDIDSDLSGDDSGGFTALMALLEDVEHAAAEAQKLLAMAVKLTSQASDPTPKRAGKNMMAE